MATVTRYFCLRLTSVLLLRYVCSYILFFSTNVVFPAQAEYFYFFAEFRLKIFLYYSLNIIAYDISVLEFIGVSITSVWYLDLYRVTFCMCSPLFVARPRCHVKQHLAVLALKKAFRTELG